jgi:serine phosphatase RsbU (regulator of sigma subunit)
MIVHTVQREGFSQGEVSLLQTFANQAALAIQRAELFEQLYEKIDQLEAAQAGLAQKERLERELELAREVQQSMLPRVFPVVPGYTFAARNCPARQVGGDFYDVIRLGQDGFGLVIADVSDKGMPAALYMALTRSLILAEAQRERSPRAVLANVNRLLLELGRTDMFVTVFYGVVDARTQRLSFCRAGHDYPVLLRHGTVRTLKGGGAFLGFLDQDELGLTEEQIDLLPGDRLVLYTDGLTDASAPDGELLGLGRLCELLQGCTEPEPSDLCDAVFNSVSDYQEDAEQFDDMTMLVVQVANKT